VIGIWNYALEWLKEILDLFEMEGVAFRVGV